MPASGSAQDVYWAWRARPERLLPTGEPQGTSQRESTTSSPSLLVFPSRRPQDGSTHGVMDTHSGHSALEREVGEAWHEPLQESADLGQISQNPWPGGGDLGSPCGNRSSPSRGQNLKWPADLSPVCLPRQLGQGYPRVTLRGGTHASGATGTPSWAGDRWRPLLPSSLGNSCGPTTRAASPSSSQSPLPWQSV